MPQVRKTPFRAAIYARRKFRDVVAPDEHNPTTGEQIKEIKEFLATKPDISIGEKYTDVKLINQNADRPEFHKLISDLKSGRYNSLVIYSFELFTRDYQEAKYYFLSLFPVINIRIISVKDGYDSAVSETSPQSWDCLKKHIMNIHYINNSRIISQKALSRQSEHYVFLASIPYGYRFNPDAPGKIEQDPETSKYVKYIFERYLQGVNLSRIARELTEQFAISPVERKLQLGVQYKNKPKKDYWSDGSVRQILLNTMYKGELIIGKERSAQYAFHDGKRHRQMEGTRIPNHHAAIISEDIFQKVQDLYALQYNRRSEHPPKIKGPELPKSPFPGQVICGLCGRQMYYVRYNTCTKHPYTALLCSSHQQNIPGACPPYRHHASDIIPQVESLLLEERNLARECAEQVESVDVINGLERYFDRLIESQMDEIRQSIAQQSSSTEEQRKKLVDAIEAKKKWKKEFTPNNPWLCTYRDIPDDVSLDKAFSKKHFERIVIEPTGKVYLRIKYPEEKETLYKYLALLQENTDGTEKS